MRVALLILIFAVSGCVTMTTEAPSRAETDGPPRSFTANAQTSSSGSRTQTVGLPLSRAGKIGLWAGVAVALAYLMASDGEDAAAVSPEP